MAEALPWKGPGPVSGLRQRGGASRADAHAGSRRRNGLWYALFFPQLEHSGDTDAGNRRRLETLAGLMQHFSDRISLQPPAALVFEARSSLRCFGGIRAMRRELTHRVTRQLRAWGLEEHFHQAASPTASASLLLAGSGSNRLVTDRDRLRSALGSLPLHCLPVSESRKRQLQRSGLKYLRDIWRLPTASIRRRLGPEFVDYLERCLDRRPDPLPRWQPPALFHESRETDWPLETWQQLEPLFGELLERLRRFLRQRVLSLRHLQVMLQHEARADTVIDLPLRQATRSPEHLLMLMQTRLEETGLLAPVLAVSMQSREFQAFGDPSRQLSETREQRRRNRQDGWLRLQEQLQARLGPAAIRTLHALALHDPEQAFLCCSHEAPAPAGPPAESGLFHDLAPRPGWLLHPPQPLPTHHNRPHAPQPLHLISGPERIETGWWTGGEIRRDYYVASDDRGKRLWVFREAGDRDSTGPDGGQWFLHGLFA